MHWHIASVLSSVERCHPVTQADQPVTARVGIADAVVANLEVGASSFANALTSARGRLMPRR